MINHCRDSNQNPEEGKVQNTEEQLQRWLSKVTKQEFKVEAFDNDQTTFEIFDLQRMCKNKVQQAFLNVLLALPKSYSLLFNSDSKLSGDGEGTLDKMPKDCFFSSNFQIASTSITKSELFLSIEQEDYERAKYLLSKGTNPNIRTAYNQTPLHLASEKGNLELVEMLLHKGVDTEVKEAYGW